MKILKKMFLVLFLGASFFSQAQVECDCQFEEELTMCAELGEGIIIPINDCILECLLATGEEITVVDCDGLFDYEDQDDFDFEEWDDYDYGDWDDYDYGDWDDYDYGDWGDFEEWCENYDEDYEDYDYDCDCSGEEELDICVDLGGGFVVPMSSCEFECLSVFGDEFLLADCDDAFDFDQDWEDQEWEEDDYNYDFECDCDGQDEAIICVDLGDGFIVPLTECELDCLNSLGEEFELVIADCDDAYDYDQEWEEEDYDYDYDCDCDGQDEATICVDLGDGFIVPMTECEFECLNSFDDEFQLELADCDDAFDFEGEWDEEDYDYDYDCDCDGQDEVIVCVDFGDGYVMSMTECEFNCFYGIEGGFPAEIVDCDEAFDYDEEDFDFGFDCDCTGEEEMDLCVDLGDGFVVPMSECEFDCLNSLGAELQLGDCDDLIDYEDYEEEYEEEEFDFECDCDFEAEADLCVDLGEGFVVPMSECLFDCLVAQGLPLEIGDCEDLIDFEDFVESEFNVNEFSEDDYAELALPSQNTMTAVSDMSISKMNVYPNPAFGSETNVEFESNVKMIGQLIITDLNGNQLFADKIELGSGLNNMKLDLGNIDAGMYKVIVMANGRVLSSQSVIKK